MHGRSRSYTGGIAALGLALAGAVVAAVPAQAAVSASAPVVLHEVYGGGGNSGAPFNRDFVELSNPGAAPVDLTGWTVQYASATGTAWQTHAADRHDRRRRLPARRRGVRRGRRGDRHPVRRGRHDRHEPARPGKVALVQLLDRAHLRGHGLRE